MYPIIKLPVRVFYAMALLDKQISLDVRGGGCPHCRGPLHSATWQRKPRGTDNNLPDDCCTRWGLCCGRCRRRQLPPSVLFCGRHVYLKAVILLIVAARQRQLSPTSMSQLRAMFGVSRDTIARWMRVFMERLPASAAWVAVRGRICASVRDADVPAALLDFLLTHDNDRDRVIITACQLVPGL